jgi:succinate dehydrogenase cytochrome b556 subunit
MFATFVLTIGYFIVFMMSYHLLNGIRHLSWDLALGLEIKNLYTTGMIVLGLVFVVVVIVILL